MGRLRTDLGDSLYPSPANRPHTPLATLKDSDESSEDGNEFEEGACATGMSLFMPLGLLEFRKVFDYCVKGKRAVI